MQNAKKRQNLVYEESKKPKNTRGKKILLIFISILAVMAIGAAVVQQFIPIEEPPIQQNSWQGLTPGFKITSKLTEELGEPIEVRQLPAEKKEISYKSEYFKAYHNQVTVNKEGIVEFIKTHSEYDKNNTLSTYISKYGEPDFTLYAPNISTSSQAHVFLEEGIVVIVHEKSQIINQIWYFEPTDKETFLKTWGHGLDEHSGHPEAFPGL